MIDGVEKTSYLSSGLRIAEVWFNESDGLLGVDIIHYKQAFKAPDGIDGQFQKLLHACFSDALPPP
jgi:hypothetical protein